MRWLSMCVWSGAVLGRRLGGEGAGGSLVGLPLPGERWRRRRLRNFQALTALPAEPGVGRVL